MCVCKHPGISTPCVPCGTLVPLLSKYAYVNIYAYKYCMYHIVRVYHYCSIFSCSPHILLSRTRTRMFLIHSPCTHDKNHGNPFSSGVWWMGLKMGVGVDLPHIHNIVSNIIPKKMVAKCYSFLVQGATRISRFQHHTHVFHKYGCRFGYLDTHLSKVVSEHNWPLNILIYWCEIGTNCLGLHWGLVF